MMSKTDWFRSQTEEELMTEERAKELKLRRNRLRHAFVQHLQRAMGVRGKDEKKTDERDIYTDTSTGTVGNIRLSNDPRFVQNCKRRFDERVRKNSKCAEICRTSLERIQREAPQQTELWQDEAGAGKG